MVVYKYIYDELYYCVKDNSTRQVSRGLPHQYYDNPGEIENTDAGILLIFVFILLTFHKEQFQH